MDTTPCDFDCLMSPTRRHSAPILHADARIGESINCPYDYTTGHTGSMSEDITSTLLFARQPLTSVTNESFESTENSLDIQQPPPHVIDYWFNQLGLSLDTASSKNPSNATGSPFQFLQFDGIVHVSGFYVVRPLSDLFMICGGFTLVSISPSLQPQVLRLVPLRTLWSPMLYPQKPLRPLLLLQLKSSTSERNLTE